MDPTDIVERLREFAAYGEAGEGRILAQLALTEIERLRGGAATSPDREEVAKIIYDAFPFSPTFGCAQKPEWTPRGNSFNQIKALNAADRILAMFTAALTELGHGSR
jgi:hypothetical protein